MSPQLIAGIARGSAITALVALSTFGAGYGVGADSRTITSTVIAAAVPVALGFLGYAGYDSHRATRVALGDLKALRDSDIGVLPAARESRVQGYQAK